MDNINSFKRKLKELIKLEDTEKFIKILGNMILKN